MRATGPGRFWQAFFRAIHDFFPTSRFSGLIVLNLVPPPISEAPHETGLSGFVDVSKDTDRRDSVRNFEPVHLRPVPAPLQLKRASTGL